MKKLAFLILIICMVSTISIAQKTVRKRTKLPTDQTTSIQNNQTTSDSIKTKSSQFDTPLKILSKPRAAYPNQDKSAVCIQGKVVLRVTFFDSGEIGRISVISGLGYGATDNAIAAAKKIKFEPAMKDGKPVTVTKPVEYSFTIY